MTTRAIVNIQKREQRKEEKNVHLRICHRCHYREVAPTYNSTVAMSEPKGFHVATGQTEPRSRLADSRKSAGQAGGKSQEVCIFNFTDVQADLHFWLWGWDSTYPAYNTLGVPSCLNLALWLWVLLMAVPHPNTESSMMEPTLCYSESWDQAAPFQNGDQSVSLSGEMCETEPFTSHCSPQHPPLHSIGVFCHRSLWVHSWLL